MKKQIITAFIAGVLLAVFSYHAYMVYKLSTVTMDNQAKVNAIIDIIKSK